MTADTKPAFFDPRAGMVVLRDLLAFLRHPRLDRATGPQPISRSTTAFWLLVFSFALAAAAAVIALPLVLMFGAAPGDNLRQVFGQPAIFVVVVVVLLGPLIEEMIFRGWLTGTPSALAGTVVFLALAVGGPWLSRQFLPDLPALAAQVGFAAAGLAAFTAIQRRGGDARPAWYERVFPLTFWAQGIVFGGLHFANIAIHSLALSLVVLVPLIGCGWIWGYARIVLGFGPAWLLHAAYNLPAAVATMVMIALG